MRIEKAVAFELNRLQKFFDMDTKIQIQGEYIHLGNQLKKEELVLHIGERKAPKGSKTRQFLRAIRPKFEYISSLYPVSEQEYMFDYTGNKYKLILSEGVAKVVPA